MGSLRDREVACSASDRQGSNFESCVWRTVSSHSSHHPVLLAQFSLYVHKCGLKPESFHFLSEDGEKKEMPMPFRHIQYSRPGGLKPGTLPLVADVPYNTEYLRMGGEEAFCIF